MIPRTGAPQVILPGMAEITVNPENALEPLRAYPGSKAGEGVAQKIISLIPPHSTFIDACTGGGTLTRTKRPASRNIAVDLSRSALARFTSHPPGFTVETVEADCRSFLTSFPWQGGEFVYCDPPYLASERRGTDRQLYQFELRTPAEHQSLLIVLTSIPALVMLSGYPSDLYDQHLPGWHTHTFRVMTRRGPATEKLWMNYPPPCALHDYRFLGTGYQDRLRIRRKIARLKAKLDALPALERAALIAGAAYDQPS